MNNDRQDINTKKVTPQGNDSFPEEVHHLKEVVCKLEKALQKADDNVRRIDGEYRDTKRYLAEYRGEIDPHEMFQNELLLKQTDQTGAFAAGNRYRLERLSESPYFARIDFREKGDEEAFPFYIGRFAFSSGNELLIFDWRAPVAGMFYDCELGPAGFKAPAGRIQGDLTRKRQFKIRAGVLEYTLETSANVQDDVLQKELAHMSDEKMKSIISTIQKEQNQIIRNIRADTLVIQGVAGSGKTSIALHRIAFLLYQFQNRLSSQNVTILSPNKVFGDYISNVIPELGEEPVCELSFSDIAEIQLEGVIGFELEKDPLEDRGEDWEKRVRYKSTLEFVRLMDEYMEMLPARIFQPKDYAFGKFRVESDWILGRVKAYGMTYREHSGKMSIKYPLKKRIAMAAEDIYHRLETENIMDDELPSEKSILKSLTAMLTMKNTLSLYRDFYKQGKCQEMFVMAGPKTLEWADVWPFLYLHAAFEGVKESRITRHLVIDEMQDYTPVQFAVMNLLFPCQKTILGDFGQFLNPNHLNTLDDLKKLYGREELYGEAEFVQLNKSYRSTYEIMTFAKRLGKVPHLVPVERHGEAPVIAACENGEDEMRRLKQAVRDFEAGSYVTLGILLKTDSEARKIYDVLAGEFKVNLISQDSTSFREGISVASVRMAKGLEFDEVIIPKSDSRCYSTEYDRSLLYVACTRAMHRLTLFYVGRTMPKDHLASEEPEGLCNLPGATSALLVTE